MIIDGTPVKRFDQWIELKESLHNKKNFPHFNEGEVWWVSVGENIGREINGKSTLFSRPMVVYKKLSRELFLGIPTTSQDRIGTWYVPVTYSTHKVTAVLSQVRTIDNRRLSSRIGQLNSDNFSKIKQGFTSLYT